MLIEKGRKVILKGNIVEKLILLDLKCIIKLKLYSLQDTVKDISKMIRETIKSTEITHNRTN